MASQKRPGGPATPPTPCPLCANPALMALADRLVCGGMDDGGVAQQLGITRDQLSYHFKVCVAVTSGRGALDQEAQAQDCTHVQLVQSDLSEHLGGEVIISRLHSYLLQVEALLEAVEPGDTRGVLLAFDQARKVCEAMAKLYLDSIKGQLDATVQSEFRRIVTEAINATSPDVRKRIIAEIQSRASVFGVIGGAEVQ